MDFSSLATKYVGHAATNYEGSRTPTSKWRVEDEAARHLLRSVDFGSRALDVPVGTGRLIPIFKERRFDAYGLDISPDMLAIARNRAVVASAPIELAIGDIRNIPFVDGHFDLVTCLRFLNWIDGHGVEQAVKELTRVTKDKLLLGMRYLPPLSELGCHRSSFLRVGMRIVGVPHLQAFRKGLFYHRKNFIDGLFGRVGLEIIETRHVERRFDGTDYVFFLLRKR